MTKKAQKIRPRVLLNLFLCMFLSGCSGGKIGDLLDKLKTPVAPVETAGISGVVGTNADNGANSFRLSSLARSSLVSSQVTLDADTCTSGSYEAFTVGGGIAVVASGAFDSGLFQIDAVPVQEEMIIRFSCSDGEMLRCLAKSGDNGIICNTVADAVLGAFESALNQKITDPVFKGAALSKVAASIVEAAQNDSTATEVFKADVLGCRDVVNADECYRSAIGASIFAGSFKMMQSMASGWSVEAIFNLVTDAVGFSIDVDNIIYSDFGTNLDRWLGTDFVAQTRQFVTHVIDDQLNGSGDAYVIKLECSLGYSKYHAGGNLKYSPVLKEIDGIEQPSCQNDAALALNGFNEVQRTAIYAAMMAGGGYQSVSLGKVDCDTPQGWENPDYYCVYPPRLTITSKFKEANRNDLDGTHPDRNSNDRTLSMINVFPELFPSMLELIESPFNKAHLCAMEAPGNDGPPIVANTELCQNWFGAWVLSQKNNFSGLLGLYQYLKNASDARLSLDDIHRIFTGERFLNSRLVAWDNGYNGRPRSNGRWVSPVLASVGLDYQLQDIFRWDYDMPKDPDQVDSLLNAALLASQAPYRDTFRMFEKIPTSAEIRNFIFGSAHHEEWNPLGSKFFYGATVQDTGIPIFCRMIHKETGKAMEKELNENTEIDCLNAAELRDLGIVLGVDANGKIDLPAGFSYPYVLQERGWMGDDVGRIYALADRKTGQMTRAGDKEVLIQQMHPGNVGGCKAADDADSVVTAYLKYGWGDGTREEAARAYCMDLSDFTLSTQIRFYWGGTVEINEHDGFGNSWKWQAGQIGQIDLASKRPTDVSPICYFAPDGNISIDSQTKFASSGVGVGEDSGAEIGKDGRISNLGEGEARAKIAPCSSSPGGTKYYLVQLGSNSQSEDKANLRAYLIEAEGANSKLTFRNWSPELKWEDVFVSLDAATMESVMNADTPGSKNRVAPERAPTYTQWAKMLNQKHSPKYDPYCDDVTGPDGVPNGRCDCYVAGTHTFKSPDQCTLEDDAAEPTISNAPYWTGDRNTAFFEELFRNLGGKSGEDLHYVDEAHQIEFNGEYFQKHQAWLNFDDTFQCAFKKKDENHYRKPNYVRWDGYWKNQDGCPNEDGDILPLNWGNEGVTGGPIRLIKPMPMNNAYNVARPNTLLKLVGLATKSVGQGITISKTDKRFSFDEALALIALRNQLLPDVQVVDSHGAEVRGVSAHFESVQLNDDGNNDPTSAILRGLTRPEELNNARE